MSTPGLSVVLFVSEACNSAGRGRFCVTATLVLAAGVHHCFLLFYCSFFFAFDADCPCVNLCACLALDASVTRSSACWTRSSFFFFLSVATAGSGISGDGAQRGGGENSVGRDDRLVASSQRHKGRRGARGEKGVTKVVGGEQKTLATPLRPLFPMVAWMACRR